MFILDNMDIPDLSFLKIMTSDFIYFVLINKCNVLTFILLFYVILWLKRPLLLLPAHPPSLFPQVNSSTFQKRTALPGISIYNKTRHIPSYQSWVRQSSRRIGFQKQADPALFPLLGVPQAPQTIQPYHICRGHSSGPYKLPDCWFSLCKPLWALVSRFCG